MVGQPLPHLFDERGCPRHRRRKHPQRLNPVRRQMRGAEGHHNLEGRALALGAFNAHRAAVQPNTFLHERQLSLFRNSDLAREDPVFVAGEPVLVQRNDYERSLFNGDQGLILRATDENSSRPSLMAVFQQQGSFRAYHLEGLRKQLVHAFAMTVHKSQGSEFDHVAVLLPGQDLPLLTREILYTAITRSKKSAVVVGQRALLVHGAEKRIERFSGIADALAGE